MISRLSRGLTRVQPPTALVLDAIYFSLQRHGGISVYFQQLLERLSRDRVATSLVLSGPVTQSIVPPGESVCIVEQARRPLERYRKCRLPPEGAVFHSSYYRLPSGRTLPTVVTVHDFTYERCVTGPRRWVHAAQKNAAIRAAQAIICVSDSTRQDLLELVGVTPTQQVHVIHNGVADTFRPVRLPPASPPFVLFVGQRPGYKNFRLVLEAMGLLGLRTALRGRW